jgi:glycosyltransferase involved in cell wall biosynthesis
VKIAILGTRGIPARYGGFETFAEECGAGLAARGHDVTVYCRSHYAPQTERGHRGVRLVVLPTVRTKYTDTVVHTFLSAVHALGGGFDALLVCNAANSIFALLPRLAGIPVAVNVDGIERRRGKWGWPGRSYYRLSERLATLVPDAIVADARVIERYYRERYGAPSVFIPYGAATDRLPAAETLARFDLEPLGYYLYVSRLEPENNAHRVIEAFERVRSERKLVLVGDAPYARRYIERLRRTRDARVVFAGAVYGAGYRELQAHAFCYVQATEVGGTHPALIEAMGRGRIVVANATPENAEVVGDTGILYAINDTEDLARRLQAVEDEPERFAPLAAAAEARARECYSWDEVVRRYEDLFETLLRRKKGRSGNKSE